ncbi:MAG: transcription elongation factor subunit Spt4 [archaeon]
MADKACKKCNRITDKHICPVCGNEDMSSRWSGLLIILNPETSEVAKKLGITQKGEYALIVQ